MTQRFNIARPSAGLPRPIQATGAQTKFADAVCIFERSVWEPEAQIIVGKYRDNAPPDERLDVELINSGQPLEAVYRNIRNLGRRGRIGPDTHFFVTGHGKRIGEKSRRRHVILIGKDGVGWRTKDLIATLRDSRTRPSGNVPLSSRGVTHLNSCYIGKFANELTPDDPLWRDCICLLHGGPKTNSSSETAFPIFAALDQLAEHKRRGLPAPNPQHLFAKTVSVSGCGATLLGGDLKHAQTWRPPQDYEQAAFENKVARAWRADIETATYGTPLRSGENDSLDVKLTGALFSFTAGGDLVGIKSIINRAAHLAHAVDLTGLPLLDRAVEGGRTNIVDFLLDRRATANSYAAPGGRSALHSACAKAHSAIVERLINAGAHLNEIDDLGYTPLVHAVLAEDERSVDLLLEAGAESDRRCGLSAFTALHLACQRGATLVVRLIRSGACLNARDERGLTPLMYAAQANDATSIKLLLARRADAKWRDRRGFTALSFACSVNAAQAAEALLLFGPHDSDALGDTPLHIACSNDARDVIKLLLETKAFDLESGNWVKDTPLLKAKTFETMQMLIEAGANVKSANSVDDTLLHRICELDPFKIDDLLFLSNDFDLEARRLDGKTPLALACHKERIDIVEALLARAANPNAVDQLSRTPLMHACRTGGVAIAQMLIDAGANPLAQDVYGLTPLMFACAGAGDRLELARLCLSAQPAAIDVVSQRKCTALMFAATAANRKIVSFLLRGSANRDLRDVENKTAFDRMNFRPRLGRSDKSRQADRRSSL